MSIDLSKLSPNQLAELQQQIKDEETQREKARVDALAEPIAHYGENDLKDVYRWVRGRLADLHDERETRRLLLPGSQGICRPNPYR